MTNTSATLSTFRRAIFKNVYTCLNGNVTDISSACYSSYPVKDISLPLLVIEGAIVSDPKWVMSERYTQTGTVLIDIYAKQSEKLDAYADEVDAKLWSYDSTFKSYGLYLTQVVDSEGGQFEDAAGNKVHSRILSVLFELK
jgi:hypothetical protein